MNKLLTNFPVTLTEEQKNVLKLTLSAVLQDDPITKYWRPTVYENGDIMWALVASETDPVSQNIKGPSGFTPQFQIDQSTAEWQVTYDGTNWTPLGIIASGAQGPQGNPGQNGTNGTDGKDGTSIYLEDVSTIAGGTQVTLGWGTSDTSAFVIPSGTPGTNGQDGFSPTVTTSEIEPTTVHPQGGTSVTITDKTGPNQFNVWNGINGEGATVNLLEGTGIHIDQNGINYTIGVSADYALKSYANEASANALSEAETWVTQKNFATSAGLDADKQYAMTTNGWSDFTIPSTSGYLPLSGGTVSGQLIVSYSAFDTFELKRSDQQGSTGIIGVNGAGGMSLKAVNGNNNTQLNIAPNATMDKRFSIGDSPYSPAAYFIPAVTATTTAGLTDDGILHIILESE